MTLIDEVRTIARGELDPESRVTLTEADHTLGSGVLRFLAPGLAPMLEDLACLMIIVSDDVATNVVIRTVGGPDAVNPRRLPAMYHADDVGIEMPLRVYNKTGVEPNMCADVGAALYAAWGDTA